MPTPTSEATQAAILKPELGFEAFFQGQRAVDTPPTIQSVPIPFFQWENRQPPDPFDPFAGKDGYDPDLMRFLPCGKSTPIELWIPLIAASSGPSAGLVRRYRYRLVWRLQSLARAQDETLAGIANQYHIPYDAPGAPDTSGGPTRRRNIMPCAVDTTATSLVDIDTATGFPPVVSTARDFYVGDSIIVDIGATGRPLVKGSRAVAVRGVYQQGIVDPAVITSDYPFIPDFAICEVIARGDQMMIQADRIGIETDPAEPANWDFADWDSGFSTLYGINSAGKTHPPFPDVGIYVFFESSPRGPALQRIGPLPNAPPTPPVP